MAAYFCTANIIYFLASGENCNQGWTCINVQAENGAQNSSKYCWDLSILMPSFVVHTYFIPLLFVCPSIMTTLHTAQSLHARQSDTEWKYKLINKMCTQRRMGPPHTGVINSTIKENKWLHQLLCANVLFHTSVPPACSLRATNIFPLDIFFCVQAKNSVYHSCM